MTKEKSKSWVLSDYCCLVCFTCVIASNFISYMCSKNAHKEGGRDSIASNNNNNHTAVSLQQHDKDPVKNKSKDHSPSFTNDHIPTSNKDHVKREWK